MTTTVLDPVVTAVRGGDELPAHYTCCDETVAMCGRPLAGGVLVSDEDPAPDCRYCVYIWDGNLPCTSATCPAVFGVSP